MKKLLSILLLVVSVSVSAQKITEKFSISKSFYGPIPKALNESFDIALGIIQMNLDKRATLRKELEFELALLNGSESTKEFIGYEALEGYSLASKFKLMPAIQLKHLSSVFAGPVVGFNLKTHLKKNYFRYISESQNLNNKVEFPIADEKLNRFFWGMEGGLGSSFLLKNGNRCRVELSFLYYFNLAKSIGDNDKLDRYGFKVSLVNPTGLIFRNKELGKE